MKSISTLPEQVIDGGGFVDLSEYESICLDYYRYPIRVTSEVWDLINSVESGGGSVPDTIEQMLRDSLHNPCDLNDHSVLFSSPFWRLGIICVFVITCHAGDDMEAVLTIATALDGIFLHL